jgi:hypothetical protein
MRAVSPVSLNSRPEPLTAKSMDTHKGQGSKFQDVMDQNMSQPAAGLTGPDLYPQLVKLQADIMRGKNFSPRELLGYQIMAGQFNLRVEMLCKVAESASAAVKKFQTPQ